MAETVVTRIAPDRLSPDMRAAWQAMSDMAGEAVTIEAMAVHPALLRWYMERFYGDLFGGAGGDMTLDQRSKEVLRLRLSKGHGCHVCNSGNEPASRAVGLTEAQIAGILAPPPGLFDERDQAVIDLAAELELSNMQGLLSPELHARLRRHYDDAQILELGMIGAFLTGMAKFLFVFDLVTREPGCPILRPPVAAAAE